MRVFFSVVLETTQDYKERLESSIASLPTYLPTSFSEEGNLRADKGRGLPSVNQAE
jgi:hypothetical protein